jgi:hypothetical protein
MNAHYPRTLTEQESRAQLALRATERRNSPHDLGHPEVARQIEQLERGLLDDDPTFLQRFSHLERARRRNEVAVFGLLVVSVVLLAMGLAVQSIVAGGLGVAAYLLSFMVDRHYQHKLAKVSWATSKGTPSH